MTWAEYVARLRDMGNMYKTLVEKHEGRRLLGRPSRRWEDNIKMELTEMGFEAADWIHLAQDMNKWRDLMNTVMNIRVP
jgi:hypothetical protein